MRLDRSMSPRALTLGSRLVPHHDIPRRRAHPYIARSETHTRAHDDLLCARTTTSPSASARDVARPQSFDARDDGVCDDDVDDDDGDGDVARDVVVVETDARNRETRDDDDGDDDGRGPREEGFHAAARNDDDETRRARGDARGGGRGGG